MTFLHAGLALAGVIAVAVPILIHLLSRRRRKPIEWAAMRFLLEAFRRHRRRLRIEQLLLLATRCLIVLLLGLALARPLLEQTGLAGFGGGRAVFIVIDDGLVSQTRHPETGLTAFEAHIERAASIIESLETTDMVGVVRAARPAGGLVSPPSSDHTAVLRLLETLEPSDAPTDLREALRVTRDAIETIEHDRDRAVVYLLSEFRRGSVALDEPLGDGLADLGDRVTLLASPPVDQPVSNVRIREIDPIRPVMLTGQQDGSGQVTVRLERDGVDLGAATSRVELGSAGWRQPLVRTLNWQPGQSSGTVEFLIDVSDDAVGSTTGEGDRATRSPGGGLLLTAQTEADALPADNRSMFALDLRDRIRALVIDRRTFGVERSLDRLPAGRWIRRSLQPIENGPIEVIEVEPAALDERDLRLADVAVASRPDLLTDHGWAALRAYVDRGGLLIITPPGEATVHQWVDRLNSALDLNWPVSIEIDTADTDAPHTLAAQQPASEILRLISSELGDLARSVVAWRRLNISTTDAIDATRESALLRFADGAPLLIAGSPDAADGDASDAARSDDDDTVSRGLVAMLTVAPELEWTNLPAQPLMVPLFQELVRQGVGVLRGSNQITIGSNASMTAALGRSGIGRSAASDAIGPDDRVIALDDRGRPLADLHRAGVYRLRDVGRQPIGDVVVQIDPDAARTAPQQASSVSGWLNAAATNGGTVADGGAGAGWRFIDTGDPAAALRDRSTGMALAGWLLAALLTLVLLELVMARYFSHALSPSASATDQRFGTGTGTSAGSGSGQPGFATPSGGAA